MRPVPPRTAATYRRFLRHYRNLRLALVDFAVDNEVELNNLLLNGVLYVIYCDENTAVSLRNNGILID